MDQTPAALATLGTTSEKAEPNIYGTVFYDDENGKVIMFKSCSTKTEYDMELAHAVRWAESEASAVGVRGVPVGGAL